MVDCTDRKFSTFTLNKYAYTSVAEMPKRSRCLDLDQMRWRVESTRSEDGTNQRTEFRPRNTNRVYIQSYPTASEEM